MTEITSKLSTALADRYAIEREIGAGGMATVYLAEDLKHKRKVAVKVLRPELAAVLGAERFVQEITTTANLQHPHILPLLDSGEADSFLTQDSRRCSRELDWSDERRLQAPLTIQTPLIVVENFFEELKAKVGN
jgi:serine/threonine protein kinase